ncbi:hypothetical protein [Streptomyces sp. NPDC088674]|uniref:hypothetical protein n=1 Tax=Streptomyces sp. NPDC088674 TaxID=3365869 RepID=UPI0038187932
MPLISDSSPTPSTYRVKITGGCTRTVPGVLTVEHTPDDWLRLLSSTEVLLAVPLDDVTSYGTVVSG